MSCNSEDQPATLLVSDTNPASTLAGLGTLNGSHAESDKQTTVEAMGNASAVLHAWHEGVVNQDQWANAACVSIFELQEQVATLLTVTKTQQDALLSAEQDTLRLEYVIDNDAFFTKTDTDVGGKAYQLWTQNDDEEFIVLSGIGKWFKSTRDAIDAAVAIKNNSNKQPGTITCPPCNENCNQGRNCTKKKDKAA